MAPSATANNIRAQLTTIAGVPMRWVMGDAIYGDAPDFRDGVHDGVRWYVLGVSSTTPVWRQRPAVQDGEKGRLPMTGRAYAWWSVWTAWLLVRRSVTDPTAVKFFLSNAPVTVTLPTLARVASTRFAVEQCFEEAKGQAGLDEYEVRLWSSWHRHITLTMMAHAWLTVVRAEDAAAIPALETPKRGGGSVGRAHNTRSAALDSDCHAAA